VPEPVAAAPLRPRRLVTVHDRYAELGELVDVFHSFCPDGEALVCAFRRMRLASPGQDYLVRPAYFSEVHVTTLRRQGGALVSGLARRLTDGEDPRAFLLDGAPMVLVHRPRARATPYRLCDLRRGTAVDLAVDPAWGFAAGKNWQPFGFEGRLYVVHGFAPLRVLAFDPVTGRGEPVLERDVGLDFPAHYDGYTMFRGGTAVAVAGGGLAGLGHMTTEPGRHVPFAWRLAPDGTLALGLGSGFQPLADEGLGVVDPTSWFVWDGRWHVGLSCSNRGWFSAQRFASFLAEIDPPWPAAAGDTVALRAMLAGGGRPPAPRRRAFQEAGAMRGEAGGRTQDGQRVAIPGQHAPGLLALGLGVVLAPGAYLARIHFAAAGPPGAVAGRWTIGVRGEAVALAGGDVPGTGDRMATIAAGFALPAAAAVEVAVWFGGGVALRLTDIAVDPDDQNPAPGSAR